MQGPTINVPLNNDRLSTTAPIFGSEGWSLYTVLTVQKGQKMFLQVLDTSTTGTGVQTVAQTGWSRPTQTGRIAGLSPTTSRPAPPTTPCASMRYFNDVTHLSWIRTVTYIFYSGFDLEHRFLTRGPWRGSRPRAVVPNWGAVRLCLGCRQLL